MKVKINCQYCGYYWYNEEFGRETCNYWGPDEWAPCEQEDDEYEEENW